MLPRDSGEGCFLNTPLVPFTSISVVRLRDFVSGISICFLIHEEWITVKFLKEFLNRKYLTFKKY